MVTFGLLWSIAALATPVTPWLQPVGDESLALGLSPLGWSDVMIGTLTAAAVSAGAAVVALAGRGIWVPALVALYAAPPAADKVGGMDYVVPHLAGHWNDWIFGRGEVDLDRLLLLTWLGMAVEVVVIAVPALAVLRSRRPSVGDLAIGTAVVAVMAILDVLFLEGLVAGPLALVTGLAGLGALAWLLAGALVLWALAIAGPFGLLSGAGATRALVPDRDRSAAP